mmetsp:Transcript_12828/g.16536  ORF Transcript_12828/g.16536 Transcript_12828/m.16536 type:complete len:89 (+) Transcript_12828:404-670(+)
MIVAFKRSNFARVLVQKKKNLILSSCSTTLTITFVHLIISFCQQVQCWEASRQLAISFCFQTMNNKAVAHSDKNNQFRTKKFSTKKIY